ncbi:TPA: hypothetical protein ACPVXB_005074 [Vibrio parahaemolyticus]
MTYYQYRHHLVNSDGQIKTLNEKPVIAGRICVDGKYMSRHDYILQALKESAPESAVNEYLERGTRHKNSQQILRGSNPELFQKFYYIVTKRNGDSQKVWNLAQWCADNNLVYSTLITTIKSGLFSKTGHKVEKFINPERIY